MHWDCRQRFFLPGWIIGFCFLFYSIPGRAAPSDEAAKLMDRLQGKYSALFSLQADFTQNFVQGKDQRLESGVLYLGRGSRMRWDYTRPEPKLFMIDGHTQYTWIPSENRVYREKLKESEDERTPILMLLGKLKWRRVFSNVEMLGTSGDTAVVRAEPKNTAQDFQDVILKIDAKSLRLLGITIDNRDSTRMEFTFSNIVENPRIDPQRFTFVIPKGAEVVSPGGM